MAIAAFKRDLGEAVGIDGDGGFLMTGFELETAVRYGLDVTVVVFRNGMHGTIAMHQARHVGRLAGAEIGRSTSLQSQGVSGSGPPALVEVLTDPDLITPDDRLSQLAQHHDDTESVCGKDQFKGKASN